eukprot:1160552-Pelagomonas_calceolata.AAC.8
MAEIKARAMSGRLSTRSSMDSYSSIDMVQRSKSSSATQAHGARVFLTVCVSWRVSGKVLCSKCSNVAA